MKKLKVLNLILPICSVIAIFLLWLIIGATSSNKVLVPTLGEVFAELGNTLKSSSFYYGYLATLWRSVIAFTISFLVSLTLAGLGKRYGYFERVISPLIKIVRALPTIAIVMWLVLCTNSRVAPVIVTMLVVLPTTYESVKESLNAVDDKQVEMCRLFGVNGKQIFFKVQLPQIMPTMLTAMGAGLSLNLKLMVAAEVISATPVALGFLLNVAQSTPNIASMLGVVLLCVVTGLVIELIFSLISKKVGKWQ